MITVTEVAYLRGYTHDDHLLVDDDLAEMIGEEFDSMAEAKERAAELRAECADPDRRRNRHRHAGQRGIAGMTGWTKPFHGVTHLGTPDDVRWATVENCGGSAYLMRWMKGDGFSCRHGRFPSVEEAKAAGEAWVERGV